MALARALAVTGARRSSTSPRHHTLRWLQEGPAVSPRRIVTARLMTALCGSWQKPGVAVLGRMLDSYNFFQEFNDPRRTSGMPQEVHPRSGNSARPPAGVKTWTRPALSSRGHLHGD
jgi:hypothetical protein